MEGFRAGFGPSMSEDSRPLLDFDDIEERWYKARCEQALKMLQEERMRMASVQEDRAREKDEILRAECTATG